jgi:hypothetical protein
MKRENPMKTIASFRDLIPYGIDALTGEACGLGYRLLCDVTAKGKVILEKLWGVQSLSLHPNWNQGTPDNPHIGSIMLTPDMWQPIGIFALLESGCREVWLMRNGSLLGIEPQDTPEELSNILLAPGNFQLTRRYAYRGTAGDRNVHQMTGRIE